MNGYFKHLFGGWREAEASRWTNPDGSEGGIVAKSASVSEGITIPIDVVVWPNARITQGASIGDSASIGNGAGIEADDWLYVAGPQGSRNAFATVTYSEAHGLRWWIGCQHGIDTETLRERIDRDHGTGLHADDCLHLIQLVETHPGLARKRAGIEARKAVAPERQA